MTDETMRKQKKSETLEVRLPHETKQAFLTACREDGTTASEVVRGSIDDYLEAHEKERGRLTLQPDTGNVLAMIPKPLRKPRVALGMLGAAGLTAMVIMPSAADPDYKSAFNRMDADKNGVLTAEEFLATRAGGDGKADINTNHNVVIMNRRSDTKQDGGGSSWPAPPAAAQGSSSDVKEDAFTFWLPSEEGQAGPADGLKASEVKIITRREVRINNTTDGSAPEAPEFHVQSFSLDDLRKREFTAFDTNGDGTVTYQEFEGRQKAMLTRGFEMLDADGDKSLSQAEYVRIASPPMPNLGKDGPQIAIPEISGMKTSNDKLVANFAKLDKDGNGRLSLQEYLPPS